MDKSIYDLKLHESVDEGNSLIIQRVPNGWNYIYLPIGSGGVAVQFIPYNKEFLPDDKKPKTPKKDKTPKNRPESVYSVYFQFIINGLLPDEAWKKANDFMNFYNTNGWKVGKNLMKDWKSAVNGTWTKEYPTLFPFQRNAMKKIVERLESKFKLDGESDEDSVLELKKFAPELFTITELPKNWADKYGVD